MSSLSSMRVGAQAVLIGLLLAGSAQAQFVNEAAARWYVGGAIAGQVYNPWWGWGVGGGGTTAAESYHRGMADVIRARGEYQAHAARAARDYEAARSAYIENQTQWLAEYNQRKRMGQAQRLQEQQQRREAIDRARSARESARAQELPVPSQIDPDTGAIDWPTVLQEPRYAELTTKLDTLMRQWAQGQDASLLAPQVAQTADQLQAQLHANIRDYAANEFIAADRLLTALQRLAGPQALTSG
jgi:hypothetical protein